jgi:hypothetical protein
VPGGSEIVAEELAHELKVTGEEEAGDRRVVGEGEDLGTEGVGEALIGIEMELPGVAAVDGVDGPVALGAVVGEGAVGTAGVDDVDVVGESGNARERGREGISRIEGEKDDGRFHRPAALLLDRGRLFASFRVRIRMEIIFLWAVLRGAAGYADLLYLVGCFCYRHDITKRETT